MDHIQRGAPFGMAIRLGQVALYDEPVPVRLRAKGLGTQLNALHQSRASPNRAELQIKITLLSLDGQIRPEFQKLVLDDALRMIPP